MNTRITEHIDFNRAIGISLVIGVIASIIVVIGLFISGAQLFFEAYLFSFMFWLGISLGGLTLLMLHFLTSNRWGLTLRRTAEAAAGSVWAMALLFIPLLFGLSYLYIWARPAEVAANASLQHQTFYLNIPFFILRAVIYFIIWMALAYFGLRKSAQMSNTPAGDEVMRGHLQGLGAFGLIAYGVFMTLAAIDWVMSLQPFWTSTIFGLVIIMGQVLTALGFFIIILNAYPALGLGMNWNWKAAPIPYKDLGAITITLVMGWAYMVFFQYLIMWAGNEPDQVVWYTSRSNGNWWIVAFIFMAFEFAVPFALLITARIRHNMRALAVLGAVLMVANLASLFWHIKPVFSPDQFTISWLDVVMPFAIGGLYIAAYLFVLKGRPSLTEDDVALIYATQEGGTIHVEKPGEP